MESTEIMKTQIEKVQGNCDQTWEEIVRVTNLDIHPDTQRKGCLALKWASDLDMLSPTPEGRLPTESLKAARENQATGKELSDEAKGILEDARLVLWQTRDERNALNAQRRVAVRAERNVQMLEEELKKIGRERYTPIDTPLPLLDDDPTMLVIMINDVHYGAAIYQEDEEKRRFQEYAAQIKRIADRHHASVGCIFLMGDLISGMIHKSIQVTNRENVITQVMRVSELVADFLYDMEHIFDEVRVYSVPGNHSRIDKKEDSLTVERLDDIIFWYARGVLAGHGKIAFQESNSTLCEAILCKQRYVAVHGDYDEFSDAGCMKLVAYLGYKPKAVFYAHRHTVGMREYNGVMQIQSGSMCGSGDDFTVRKRLRGDPALSVCVVNGDGIEALYPVNLS